MVYKVLHYCNLCGEKLLPSADAASFARDTGICFPLDDGVWCGCSPKHDVFMELEPFSEEKNVDEKKVCIQDSRESS